MVNIDEAIGPVLIHLSDLSTYMTGSVLTVDRGFTAWRISCLTLTTVEHLTADFLLQNQFVSQPRKIALKHTNQFGGEWRILYRFDRLQILRQFIETSIIRIPIW